MDHSETIREIIDLFIKYGASDYIGEPLTQTEHMTQAAMLAEENFEDLDMIVAAFLHDIGHLLEINGTNQMDDLGVRDHELVAKQYLLSKNFTAKTANLVGNHVKAKRYLVTKYQSYYHNLSDASKQTLIHQNGFMTEKELAEFESDPYFQESIRLRGYDDQAKISGYKINSLDYYKNILQKYFNKIDL